MTRHAVEQAGARFSAVADGHALLGTVSTSDDVLVLARQLLPESDLTLALLDRDGIVVLPAGQGAAAGFERIDADWVWAGAMLLPGALVERLAELPAETDTPAALLRIALQSRLAYRALSARAVVDGAWSLVTHERLAEIEEHWLDRNMPVQSTAATLSAIISNRILRRSGLHLAAWKYGRGIGAAGALLALGGASLAMVGLVAPGLLLIAAAWLLAVLGDGQRLLSFAPYAVPPAPRATREWPHWVIDAALLATAWFASDAAWPVRLFPMLVLLLVLHRLEPQRQSGWKALAGDRFLLSVILALAAALGLFEPVLMLAGLVAILLSPAAKADDSE
ncbi:hypothetical protein GRI97_12990 [Altererythrobacter xixiisoli]|uniref:Uncharacterized protein n=1 Tax=Croceibacterium xixiisoli TaxID=1476466 RepID=A0A6I4TZW5_9SPHN|nr:hypothetical protein [Croceibacterium xixiisoli]MXO99903.1 hypothetical protein [Croceibacterium xixiisoli]